MWHDCSGDFVHNSQEQEVAIKCQRRATHICRDCDVVLCEECADFHASLGDEVAPLFTGRTFEELEQIVTNAERKAIA